MNGACAPARRAPGGCGCLDMLPSIRIGLRLFPVSEFENWVACIIAPIQEAPRKDATPFPKNTNRPRKIDKTDSLLWVSPP